MGRYDAWLPELQTAMILFLIGLALTQLSCATAYRDCFYPTVQQAVEMFNTCKAQGGKDCDKWMVGGACTVRRF